MPANSWSLAWIGSDLASMDVSLDSARIFRGRSRSSKNAPGLFLFVLLFCLDWLLRPGSGRRNQSKAKRTGTNIRDLPPLSNKRRNGTSRTHPRRIQGGVRWRRRAASECPSSVLRLGRVRGRAEYDQAEQGFFGCVCVCLFFFFFFLRGVCMRAPDGGDLSAAWGVPSPEYSRGDAERRGARKPCEFTGISHPPLRIPVNAQGF